MRVHGAIHPNRGRARHWLSGVDDEPASFTSALLTTFAPTSMELAQISDALSAGEPAPSGGLAPAASYHETDSKPPPGTRNSEKTVRIHKNLMKPAEQPRLSSPDFSVLVPEPYPLNGAAIGTLSSANASAQSPMSNARRRNHNAGALPFRPKTPYTFRGQHTPIMARMYRKGRPSRMPRHPRWSPHRRGSYPRTGSLRRRQPRTRRMA